MDMGMDTDTNTDMYTDTDTDRDRVSEGSVFVSRCVAVSAAITAISGTTTLAYFIFQGIRHTRFESMLDASFRVLQGLIRSLLSMDPMIAAWAFPLALGFIVVVGMLIHRHFSR